MKSVFGEFSSGVSTCRNKDHQPDLGPPFYQGPPTGDLPSALITSKLFSFMRNHKNT